MENLVKCGDVFEAPDNLKIHVTAVINDVAYAKMVKDGKCFLGSISIEDLLKNKRI